MDVSSVTVFLALLNKSPNENVLSELVFEFVNWFGFNCEHWLCISVKLSIFEYKPWVLLNNLL